MDDANSEPTVMPFDLLRELTDGFSEGVHQDGKKIAVKKLYDMPGLDDDKFQNEFKNLARLRHQNIVRLVGYCRDIQEVHIKHEGKLVLAEKTHRALCLEYMSNGSLAMYLSDDCDRYDWHTGYGIIKGISQGLKYLHKELQPPIYHLDLKPDNVLLDENMVPRIADFGMSKLFKDEHTRATNSPLGTIGYLPPEYINNNLISNKFDIFSLGVMIIKIMAGDAGYFRIADMPSQAFINLVHESWMNRLGGASNLMKAYSEQVNICIEIGLSCVQVDRHKRPTIQDIIDRLNETETKCTDASIKDWLLIYQDCYIPDYLLKPECEQVIVDHAPLCPVVVFINSTSGRQLGSILIKTCRELLNGAQVFDLSEEAPDKVLHRLYANFEKLKCQGDTLAIQIQRNLRLIGKKNPATDQQAVKSLLEQVKGAREMNIDSWHVMLRLRVPQEGPCDPIRPLELPDSLHEFDHVSDCSHLNMNGYHTFHGGFWSSFSMGLDAQVSYNFHSARKFHPEKFIDKGTYDKLGRKQGWFAASPSQPSSRNIGHLAKVKVMKRPGHHWEELMIPYSTRSVVCLNLPSFSGGLDPWGEPGTKARDRDLTESYADDGLIEVVGFSKAWHGIDLLAPNGHGSRLAQVYRIRFEFHKGAADHTFMAIDGKPWRQPLPSEDETVTVEISHGHQVTVLVNDPCRSKSVADPDCDSLEDEDEWEERKKFGAANSFKISDEVDIAHLS